MGRRKTDWEREKLAWKGWWGNAWKVKMRVDVGWVKA